MRSTSNVSVYVHSILVLLLVFMSTQSGLAQITPHPENFLIPDSLLDSSLTKKQNYLSVKGLHSIYDPDSALIYFKQAEYLAKQSGDSTAMLASALDMGHFLMSKGIYGKALDYMYTGIAMAEAKGDSSRQLFFLNWQARVFTELGDHEKAIEVCESALTLKPKSALVPFIKSTFGKALTQLGRFTEAEIVYMDAYENFSGKGEKIGSHMVAARLASLYQKTGDVTRAREFATKVIPSWKELGAYESFITTTMALMRIDSAEGALEDGIAKGHHILEEVEGRNYLSSSIAVTDLLASLYEANDDYPNALKFTRLADSLRKEYELDKVKINLAVMEAEFTNERLLANFHLVEEQQKAQSYLLFGLAGGLVLFLIVGLLMFRSNRRTRLFNITLKRKNQALDMQNASLDQLNQEKDMLMQIVAHDLKSPLNSVRGLSELLETMGELTPQQIGILQQMDKAVGKGLDLIRNLLDLSALESGKLDPKPKQVELSTILEKIRSEFSLKAEKKSISLNLKLPDSPVSLQTDPSHYERIVENLVSNAIKYSPRGKRVWIELSSDFRETQTIVRDEGPGISAEDQEKMFGKFQRLTARPTGGESSNGLGLAIVKALADQLKGTIEVDSQLGKGTEFAFTLPS